MNKKISLIIAAVMLMLISATSQAKIMQDIIVDNVVAEPGNLFGITDGFSGVVGSITYNPSNLDPNGFGDITTAIDSDFFFEVTFGAFTFSSLDDVDPFGPLALLADPTKLFDGIDILEAFLESGGLSLEFGPGFVAGEDVAGIAFTGDISFGQAIPEPAMPALFLSALAMLRIRRRAQ